jgi:hypothetical protein
MKTNSTLAFSLLSLFFGGSIAAAPLLCQGSGGAASGRIMVPDRTVVHLVLMDELQGRKMKAGEQVHFLVREDLVVEHQILIRNGSIAVGHITLATKNGFVGKSGKLGIQIDSAIAVDGTEIRLRGGPEVGGGREGAVTAAATAEYGPGALFIRGWDARIPVGTKLNAFVDGNQPVSIAPTQ